MFSYRLSIIHFWALIFIYIWAGPHHLLFTALPDWAQSLGMVFSLMLIAPSWGGMLNGLLTLRGAARDKGTRATDVEIHGRGRDGLRHGDARRPDARDQSVNSLSHYTDWTIAHVHGRTGLERFHRVLNALLSVPRLWNTKLYSTKLANWHFWIALLGMMFYVVPMYASGITQGMMWKQFTKEGFLQYPNFPEIVTNLVDFYKLRALGGSLYIIGAVLMAYNLWRTAKAGKFEPDTEAQAAARRWLKRRTHTMIILTSIAGSKRNHSR